MFKKYLFVPIATLMLSFLFPISAYAAQFHTGEYTLDAQSVVEDDLYVTGNNTTIKGVVDGDLVVFGDYISIDGTVSGDLYAFGGTNLDISGNIYGNVFALGSNINVGGTVGSNAYIVGMMVNLDANVGKDLTAAAGTVKLSGSIGDDVRVATGQLSSEATVTGDFIASTSSPIVNEEKISGQYILSSANENQNRSQFRFGKDDLKGFNLGLSIVGFVGMYIVGVLLIYAAPVKTVTIGKKVSSSFNEFIKSFGLGFIILLAIPLPLFILTMTLVGAPLSILLTAILIFLATFGTLWSETAIGFKVLSLLNYKDNQRLLSLLTGRFITIIFRLIPFVSPIYMMILSATTIGAVVRTKYDAFQAATKKK